MTMPLLAEEVGHVIVPEARAGVWGHALGCGFRLILPNPLMPGLGSGLDLPAPHTSVLWVHHLS